MTNEPCMPPELIALWTQPGRRQFGLKQHPQPSLLLPACLCHSLLPVSGVWRQDGVDCGSGTRGPASASGAEQPPRRPEHGCTVPSGRRPAGRAAILGWPGHGGGNPSGEAGGGSQGRQGRRGDQGGGARHLLRHGGCPRGLPARQTSRFPPLHAVKGAEARGAPPAPPPPPPACSAHRPLVFRRPGRCWAASLRRCVRRCTTAARCLALCTCTRARRRCPLVRAAPSKRAGLTPRRRVCLCPSGPQAACSAVDSFGRAILLSRRAPVLRTCDAGCRCTAALAQAAIWQCPVSNSSISLPRRCSSLAAALPPVQCGHRTRPPCPPWPLSGAACAPPVRRRDQGLPAQGRLHLLHLPRPRARAVQGRVGAQGGGAQPGQTLAAQRAGRAGAAAAWRAAATFPRATPCRVEEGHRTSCVNILIFFPCFCS